MLRLLTLYSTLFCDRQIPVPEQKELIIYSTGGSKIVHTLDESKLKLPGEKFNGHELIDANPESKSSLDKLFEKIVCEFGFKHPYPLDIKFISQGKIGVSSPQFTCVNSQTCTVRASGSGRSSMIFIDINGFGRLSSYYSDWQNQTIFPLFGLSGYHDSRVSSKVKVLEEIGEGVTLEEYGNIVKKHLVAYRPRFQPTPLRICDFEDSIDCGAVPTRIAYGRKSIYDNGRKSIDDRFCNIYDAIHSLLRGLKEKTFLKESRSLLSLNPKLYAIEKPKHGRIIESIPDFIDQHFYTTSFNVQYHELISIVKSGPSYKLFCPIEEAFFDCRYGRLWFKTARDRYIGKGAYIFVCAKELGNENVLIPLEEGYDSLDLVTDLEIDKNRDRVIEMLEYIRPHIGVNKPPVLLFEFAMADTPYELDLQTTS